MWFRVDDSFPQHPKVLAIPRKDRAATIGLWAMAGIWCSHALTDGYLGEHMVEELAGQEKHAEHLVRVGLWERAEGGYQIHDFLDYNPSADEVRAEQARKHEAKARAGRVGGVASGAARRKHSRSSGEAKPKQDGSETKPRPDPTRPDPSSASVEGGSTDPNADGKPPLFPDHCRRHTAVAVPGNCGACADVRKANKGRRHLAAVISPTTPASKPHCGDCDETRHRETPFGVIRCPECHPRAEESA